MLAAPYLAGLWNTTLQVANVTAHGNRASGSRCSGGGLYLLAIDTYIGGVGNTSVAITGLTVTGNGADVSGGGALVNLQSFGGSVVGSSVAVTDAHAFNNTAGGGTGGVEHDVVAQAVLVRGLLAWRVTGDGERARRSDACRGLVSI